MILWGWVFRMSEVLLYPPCRVLSPFLHGRGHLSATFREWGAEVCPSRLFLFDEGRHARPFEGVQGYLAHKKLPPPQDHHRSPGIGLL